MLFSPAHASSRLSPSTPKTRNTPMGPGSQPTTPRSYMRAREASPRSVTYSEQWGGSVQSLDPGYGMQSATSYSSQIDDEKFFGRRQQWNQSAHLNTGQPAWGRYGREDRLNVNLEMHPFWVAKSPGTYDSTRERWNLHYSTSPPSPSSQSARSRPSSGYFSSGWNGRFISAHTLDGNPVENGMRTLSPARRRHNGGVGSEGLV